MFKRNLFKYITFISFTCFLLFFCSVSTSYAQSQDLSLIPPVVETVISPGKIIVTKFSLKNESSDTVLIPSIFRLDNEGNVEGSKAPVDKWIRLVNIPNTAKNKQIILDQPFSLLSSEIKELYLRIDPPENVEEGDYYRLLSFTPYSLQTPGESVIRISNNISALLLITVTKDGMLGKSAKIKANPERQIIDSFSPIKINFDVENTGTTYFRPLGNISFKSHIGSGSFNILPQVIFPGQAKRIVSSILPENNDNNSLVLTGFFIGKYIITSEFTLSEGNIKVNSESIVFALPWKLSAGLILLTILIFWFYKLR